MSGSVPFLVPGQGSFIEFTLDTTHPQPRDERQEALAKLDECIPKTEDEWQRVRRDHGFATSADVCKVVSALVKDDLVNENLQRIIYIAIFCVESRTNEAEAYSNYKSRAKTECSVISIRSYMSLLRTVIALVDEVYPKLRHRAFEAFLLYAPLKLSSLSYYRQNPGHFKSCFPAIKILPEEHASLPLYLPFIIASRHPQYKYEAICEALGTSILDRIEFAKFVSVLDSQKLIPRLLPTSYTKGYYDPVRNTWVGEDESTR